MCICIYVHMYICRHVYSYRKRRDLTVAASGDNSLPLTGALPVTGPSPCREGKSLTAYRALTAYRGPATTLPLTAYRGPAWSQAALRPRLKSGRRAPCYHF